MNPNNNENNNNDQMQFDPSLGLGAFGDEANMAPSRPPVELQPQVQKKEEIVEEVQPVQIQNEVEQEQQQAMMQQTIQPIDQPMDQSTGPSIPIQVSFSSSPNSKLVFNPAKASRGGSNYIPENRGGFFSNLITLILLLGIGGIIFYFASFRTLVCTNSGDGTEGSVHKSTKTIKYFLGKVTDIEEESYVEYSNMTETLTRTIKYSKDEPVEAYVKDIYEFNELEEAKESYENFRTNELFSEECPNMDVQIVDKKVTMICSANGSELRKLLDNESIENDTYSYDRMKNLLEDDKFVCE